MAPAPDPSATPDPAAAPASLTPEQLQTWLSLFSVLLRMPGVLTAQLQRDAGVNLFEHMVLATLSEAPDRQLRMSELAALCRGSLPRLSQAVARAEKRGLVRRAPDPEDGRYTLATLTADGAQVLADATPGHVAEVQRLLVAPLSEAQVMELGRICCQIMRAIDPDGPQAGDAPS